MPESSDPKPSSALAVFGMVAGPRAGDELPVLAPVATIGQGPHNDIVLDDDSVSRDHARLEYFMEGWRLTDLESTNGTTVDGVRLAPGVPTPLAYGSGVIFGGVRLEFRELADSDPEAARATFTPSEPAPEKPRQLRLPLWLFLVILLLLVVVAFFLVGAADAGAALT